jgi:cyclic dehypoxanthinyl futalosine synthase
MNVDRIYKKALQLAAVTEEEALHIYAHAPTDELMEVAACIRQQQVPGNGVSWQIDRNVNYTNVCLSACLFCNFHCKPHDTEKRYTTSLAAYDEKIATLFASGGNQLLLQGGLHPAYGLAFYETLFRTLKERYPLLRLHALGPPEVAHIARLEKLTYRETLQRLVAAGLDSLPGAGAEILVDRVRRLISPGKPDVKAWIAVMREAHQLHLPTSATMVFGHIEHLSERLQHLGKIRALQEEKPRDAPGFLAFICWPMQWQGTRLAERYALHRVTPVEYIRTIAISRIMLNNIRNIQASWLTVGRATAQLCLHAGANDMGSIMMEENVLASAGVTEQMDAEGMQRAIREAGFEPWLRDQCYQPVACL